ncbi:MAG: HD domain-containing protein [Planctomycetota bacterium]
MSEPTETGNALIAAAAEFAEAAHASIDQRRKYSGEPYIVHPRQVAGLVAAVTGDAAMIAAAWLHDVVEDTPVTIEEVRERFGDDVAALVDDLTDVSRPGDGNRATRTAIDRTHTAAASPRAKTVKLADVVANLSDFDQMPRGFARVFLAEREALVAVLREGDPSLLAQAHAAVESAKRIADNAR